MGTLRSVLMGPCVFTNLACRRYRYSLGTCNNVTGMKVNKGETIRCELDMDAGTLRLIVNGNDLGVCFTGLSVRPYPLPLILVCYDCKCVTPQGYEVFPAVQFYSSGRTVRVLKLEAPPSRSRPVSETWVSGLTDAKACVGHGALGKGSDLGYASEASRKVVVNGASVAHCLSMHPPPNHDGNVWCRVSCWAPPFSPPCLLTIAVLCICQVRVGQQVLAPAGLCGSE